MKKYILITALMLLNGCASIVDNEADVISISTPYCLEARCILHKKEGEYITTITTPETVTIDRAYADLYIACEKSGIGEEIRVESKASWVWGNFLFGWLIGWAIDATTGAGYKYPEEIRHPLECE